MKIVSWNINGIRSINKKKQLVELVRVHSPDIVCLQEVRADDATSQSEIRKAFSSSEYPYVYVKSSKTKKGYSGTAIVSKLQPLSSIPDTAHNISIAIEEGRITSVEFESFVLVSVYTPNSGAKLDRLAYRTRTWDKEFARYMSNLTTMFPSKKIIIAGDLNVAPEDIDIHSPKTNMRSAGFTTEERDSYTKLMTATKFIDSFRHFHPKMIKYSYWSNFHGARAKNKGWRIDFFLVSSIDTIVDSDIIDTFPGSDHAPIILVVD